MNAANRLTGCRMLLVPFYLIFLYYSKVESNAYLWISIVIFTVVAVADAFDGYIARKLHQVTFLGSFLDPLTDKMIVWVSLVTFAYYDKVPFWLTILVVSKDVLIGIGGLALYLFECDCTITPNFWGKGAAVLQFSLVVCTLFAVGVNWFGQPSANYFFWVMWSLAAFMTVSSGISYAIIESHRLSKAN